MFGVVVNMSVHKKRMSKYIHTAEGFQYSINLEYDLQSDEKVRNYIPTTSAIDFIEELLLSTHPSSKERARIFTGAYGKGKSHLVLMLLSLLYNKDRELFNVLLEKVKIYNPKLYDYMSKYVDGSTRLLPVIVNANSLNINQNFLVSLNNTLKAMGLKDIMPNTYFNAAIDTIASWKTNYIDTYNKFCQQIKEPVNSFLEQLGLFNQKTYDKFCSIFPTLTSGSEFNPISSLNVVDLFSDVSQKIQEKGYSGIFVVYDEFSKFLEGSINKDSSFNIKLLQDFAEKCNRGGEQQLHIMLISHKSISNYVDKLPKQKVDAWRAVSERFKPIELNNTYSQIYEIISHVIIKEPQWFDSLIEKYKNAFADLRDQTRTSDLFAELEDEEIKCVVEGCYPLHPYSTYILPKVSEKIAQNERTIFTFLSSTHLNTLGRFISHANTEFDLLTPDLIYDYFEPLFKKEAYTSEIHKIWQMATCVINKLSDNILHSRIIKAIAIIYIVDEFHKLPPTIQSIISIFKNTFDVNVLSTAIGELQAKRFLYHMKSKGYLKFIESTNVNIPAMILDTIERNKSTFSVKSILNSDFFDKYLYPTVYNDDLSITRYFSLEFIEWKEILDVEDWDKKIAGKDADGIIFAVIVNDSEDIACVRNAIENISHDRIVFVIPNEVIDITESVYQYAAIKILIENSENEDDLLIDELNIYHDDLFEQIKNYVDIYVRPELRAASYFYHREEQTVLRKSMLSQLLSGICREVFFNTPVINNEVINKNVIPGVVVNYRQKVLAGILENNLKSNLGLGNTGAADISIMRSTLMVPGIYAEQDGEVSLITENLTDARLQYVLDKIKEFFFSAAKSGKRSFAKLYDTLTLPEYHIGMKRGVIPVYIAVILRSFKKYAVVMKNEREIEITAALLDEINEAPGEYEIFLEDWDEQKANYIKDLEYIFCDYILDKEKEYNTFLYIVKAMQRWFFQLPKYTKEANTAYVGKSTPQLIQSRVKKFRYELKAAEINARDFIFVKLFRIFECKDCVDILRSIKDAKTQLDEMKSKLISILNDDMRSVYKNGHSKKVSLTSIMRDWYEKLDDSVKTYLFNSGEERFLQIVGDMSNDENKFIEDVSRSIMGLRIDDWEEDTPTKFYSRIQEIKDIIESKQEENKRASLKSTDAYTLLLTDEKGNELIRTFGKSEYSESAQNFYNEITTMLEEYAEGMSNSEKRQVLIDILEELCR